MTTITVKSTNTFTRWPCSLRHAADCYGETDKSDVVAVLEPDDGRSFVCQRCLRAASPELDRFADELGQRLDSDQAGPHDRRSVEVDAVDWRHYCAHSCQCCKPGDRPCCDCGHNHHRDGDPREGAYAGPDLKVVRP